MQFMFLMSLILFLISFVILLLSSILSKKSILDFEKNSPFECGFDPKSSSRLPFSLRFFLIAVIFLIFDVEITLILPIIIIFKWSNLISWFSMTLFFLFILLLGLYHEWNQGALSWN